MTTTEAHAKKGSTLPFHDIRQGTMPSTKGTRPPTTENEAEGGQRDLESDDIGHVECPP